MASWISGLSPRPTAAAVCCTPQVMGASSRKAITAVVQLNTTCATAKRWPGRALPIMPMTAVDTAEPTLEPIAIARAWGSSSCWLARAARVSIRVAWLDCSTTVISVPTPTNSSAPRTPSAL